MSNATTDTAATEATIELHRERIDGALTRLPSVVSMTWSIIRKDILLEWRGRVRTNATIFFALLTLLLFSFAIGPDHRLLSKLAGGFLWLAVMLSSVLSLSESMRLERENDAIDGLRLIPVDARALYLGKALVNLAFLLLISLVMIPLMIAIYDVQIELGFLQLLLVLFLGCAAISAPGTLYAAIAAQARARDVLLPLLLFPILAPSLLAAVQATSLVLAGDPMGQFRFWVQLLVAISTIYWVLCTLLFGRVIEE